MTSQTTQNVNLSFVVSRTFMVPAIHCSKCAEKITDLLSLVEGINNIEIELKRRRVRVTYDVTKVMFSDIKKLLNEIGYPPSTGWWSKIRLATYQYQDENLRGNAKAGDGSCCGNPTDIYAKRRRR